MIATYNLDLVFLDIDLLFQTLLIDRSKLAVMETLKIKESPWTALVEMDCKKLKIRGTKLQNLALNRSNFSKVTHWRTFSS